METVRKLALGILELSQQFKKAQELRADMFSPPYNEAVETFCGKQGKHKY
jgi:hypothetical protein